MARFAAIPDVPTAVGAQWEAQMLDALKQNVELLAGLRGEADQASRAITRSTVRIQRAPAPTFGRVDDLTVLGEGFTISGVQVPSFGDYNRLIKDVDNLAGSVQRLANDVTNLRDTIDILLRQLKG